MSDLESHYLDLIETIQARDGRMFGVRTAMYSGKGIFSLFEGKIAFRVGRGLVPQLIDELRNGDYFDPSKRNKPFKDWVAAGIEDQDRFMEMANCAIAFLKN